MARSEVTPPDPSEIEISLFGPGYGESVLVHVGGGDWFVIDSCVVPDGRTPAVLPYFHSIGVDPFESVRVVVATHWHDDHVRGLSSLQRCCNKAEFVCSQALQNDEFLGAMFNANDGAFRGGSGVEELCSVFQALRDNKSGPRWAIADRRLWQRSVGLPCELWALSPSDAAVTKAIQQMVELTGRQGLPLLQLPSPDRNHGSVALWTSVAGFSILLGADLENSGAGMGWSAVVASQGRPTGQARVYKVSHHGGRSGDCSEIWSGLLSDRPIAILTPFSRGNKQLPTSSDVARLRNQTPYVYATAPRGARKADYGAGAKARMKHQVLRDYRRLEYCRGWVRVRVNTQNNQCRVDLFGDAVALGSAAAGQVA